MKKTISIQISGILFHIDDDAYDRLDRYLASIRNHFASIEDSEEIVSDIESRIAEQFGEKLSKSKQVISTEDVEELISSMGTVQDFEEFEGAESSTHEAGEEKEPEEKTAGNFRERRLYRDSEDQVVAGVAAGIAKYFGIDPVIVRIVFVILTFLHLFGVLLYIILWIAVPEAKTTSEKLSMRGEPVTISGLQKKLSEETQAYDLKNFGKIRVIGAIRVRVKQSKEFRVTARGPEHDLQQLGATVKDGLLTIGRSSARWYMFLLSGFGSVVVDIELPELAGIEIGGASQADIEGFVSDEMVIGVSGASKVQTSVEAKQLKLSVSGASKMTLVGKGEAMDLHVSGASHVDAKNYRTNSVDSDLSGASNADVSVSDQLDGHVRGASRLGYRGDPKVNATADGGSAVTRSGKQAPETTYEDFKHTAKAARERIRSTMPAHRQSMRNSASYFSSKFRGDDKTAPSGSRIGRMISMTAVTLLRIVGGLIALAAGIGLLALTGITLLLFVSGIHPIFGITPLAAFGFPFYYILLVAGFFLFLVPLVFLAQLGGSIAEMKNDFSLGGTIALSVFWVIALVTIIFAAGSYWPNIQDHFNRLRTSDTGGIERNFSQQDFSAIHTDSSVEVHVTKGDDYAIVARGSEKEVNALSMSVDRQILTITRDAHHGFPCLLCIFNPLQIDVTVPDLQEIDLSGASEATVDGFDENSLRLLASGASKIDFTGHSEELRVELTGASYMTLHGTGSSMAMTLNGASRILAQEYGVRKASVELHGASSAQIAVSTLIDGSIEGASRLTYAVDSGAIVQVQSTGASSLKKVE